jgi:hypothetical protein
LRTEQEYKKAKREKEIAQQREEAMRIEMEKKMSEARQFIHEKEI